MRVLFGLLLALPAAACTTTQERPRDVSPEEKAYFICSVQNGSAWAGQQSDPLALAAVAEKACSKELRNAEAAVTRTDGPLVAKRYIPMMRSRTVNATAEVILRKRA